MAKMEKMKMKKFEKIALNLMLVPATVLSLGVLFFAILYFAIFVGKILFSIFGITM
tara:strand:- start:1660 stop:1827 length:168 start_codon:yes stop_codon:yes gene_type:complete